MKRTQSMGFDNLAFSFKEIARAQEARNKPLPFPHNPNLPTKNPLFNRDFMIQVDTPPQELEKRQREALNKLLSEYEDAKTRDIVLSREKITPDQIVEGAMPPIIPVLSNKVFQDQIDEAKKLVQTTLKEWGAQFKANAETEYNNFTGLFRRQGASDAQVARVHQLIPFSDRVVKYMEDLAKRHEAVVNKFKDEEKKYIEKLEEREAKKLLAEAEKTRAMAEGLIKKKEILENQGKSDQAKIAESQANQLNKIADNKEAVAQTKLPQSKTGILLALAAAGALIAASGQ